MHRSTPWRRRAVAAGVILLALGGSLALWRPSVGPAPDSGLDAGVEAGTGSAVASAEGPTRPRPARRDRDPRGRLQPRRPGPARPPAATAPAATDAQTAAGEPGPAATPRERALRQWDALIAKACQAAAPAHPGLADSVKEALERLDRDDRLDAVQAAVNRLPDESFPVLYGVLFDREQDPEVLDAIFSDALNRPDGLKNPLLQRLRADREHPLYFESARITDVIGGAEDAAAPPAAQADGAGEP